MQSVAAALVLRRTAASATRSLLQAHHSPTPWAPQLLRFQSTESESPSVSGRDVFVYTSPYGPTVRNVKRLSLFSCACAVGAGPIILGLDAGMTLAAKASIVSTLAAFGTFTTGLLHWFVSPYVQRLEVDRGTGSISIDTLTLWGTHQHHAFHMSDVGPVDGVHPLTSFQALGKTYYVDPAHFSDKELLAQLSPVPAAEAASEAAKEEIKSVNEPKQ